MRQSMLIMVTVLVVQVYSAPQLISFKDGRFDVKFAGYHAGVGLGGAAGKGGMGGLFAEAGTPFGQNARAGLGGSVDQNGHSSGGLYAGATAGGNVKAQAGLAGGVTNEHSAGAGYASAQAGDRFASAGMGGEASGEGSSGFSFSGSKSFGVSGSKVKEVAFQPEGTVDIPQPVIKEIETEVKLDADNEINPIPAEPPVTVTKEVFAPPPTKVIEKTYVHTHNKPHRHHLHKYIRGYVASPSVEVQPVIQKRVDVASETAVGEPEPVQSGGHIGFRKQVSYQRNPDFYKDIFNIPITVLSSVSDLVSSVVGDTKFSVQKSANVHTDAEGGSSKHHIAPLSSSSSSETHVSVETPSASGFFQRVFDIPISALGAVNKFLDKNVARKTVEITHGPEDSGAPVRVRRGPHARRRANKHVIVETLEPAHPEEDEVTLPEAQH